MQELTIPVAIARQQPGREQLGGERNDAHLGLITRLGMLVGMIGKLAVRR
jgi:hypothetical protein